MKKSINQNHHLVFWIIIPQPQTSLQWFVSTKQNKNITTDIEIHHASLCHCLMSNKALDL